VLAAHFYCSVEPEGSYFDPHVGTIGPSFMVLKGGSIYLKTPYTYDREGAYSKTGGLWVTGGSFQEASYILRPGLFGIQMAHKSDPTDTRFLFRRQFVWIYRTWNWCLSVGGGRRQKPVPLHEVLEGKP
jgi:hypothetical protein